MHSCSHHLNESSVTSCCAPVSPTCALPVGDCVPSPSSMNAPCSPATAIITLDAPSQLKRKALNVETNGKPNGLDSASAAVGVDEVMGKSEDDFDSTSRCNQTVVAPVLRPRRPVLSSTSSKRSVQVRSCLSKRCIF
ncbi:unnamed protein product [Protopolystoma xenopodis]|uniref:Uncharacterized protein n=1 Tax=Protopolystoma xenopodis TaxID=117903 RepID=A0A3S5B2F1_9PLAT|nr:unnamed protein product [Protopolystoma xenopodis]